MGDLDHLFFSSAKSRTVGGKKDFIIKLKDNCMIASKNFAQPGVRYYTKFFTCIITFNRQ